MKLGPWLTIDRETGIITHCNGQADADAVKQGNKLARGSHREPFVVEEDM